MMPNGAVQQEWRSRERSWWSWWRSYGRMSPTDRTKFIVKYNMCHSITKREIFRCSATFYTFKRITYNWCFALYICSQPRSDNQIPQPGEWGTLSIDDVVLLVCPSVCQPSSSQQRPIYTGVWVVSREICTVLSLALVFVLDLSLRTI